MSACPVSSALYYSTAEKAKETRARLERSDLYLSAGPEFADRPAQSPTLFPFLTEVRFQLQWQEQQQ
jgi:hypothetical protein